MDHEEVLELLRSGPEGVADWNRQQPILTSELANLVGTDCFDWLLHGDSQFTSQSWRRHWRVTVPCRRSATVTSGYNTVRAFFGCGFRHVSYDAIPLRSNNPHLTATDRNGNEWSAADVEN